MKCDADATKGGIHNISRQFIATSAEVSPKGSLARESYGLNSGYGFIINCSDIRWKHLEIFWWYLHRSTRFCKMKNLDFVQRRGDLR